MGRNDGHKPKEIPPSSKLLKDFFGSGKQPGTEPRGPLSADKMASGKATEAIPATDLLTTTEFHAGLKSFRADMFNAFHDLLKPVTDQLHALQFTIQEVASTAETAFENGISNQESIRSLETHEKWAKEKMITLENKLRERNLKLRGFDEKAETNTDLAIFVASWLLSVLQLEEGVAPLILKAYRLGSSFTQRVRASRDIIIELADNRTREKILDLARTQGGLKYQDKEIQVFPDISADALLIRRKLKPIVTQLTEAGIRYKWLPSGAMQIRHLNKSWTIDDLEGGGIVLKSLRIQIPKECEKISNKRKLEFTSPLKGSKIPVRFQQGTV